MTRNTNSTSKSKFAAKILALCLLAALVFGGGAVLYARKFYNDNLRPVSSSQKAVVIEIPEGATVHGISMQLAQAGLIRNPRVFEQYVRGKGAQQKLQAGSYSLTPSQSVSEIVAILTQGKIVKNLFTIVPGQRLDQVKSAMINVGFGAKEVEAAFDPSLYKDHPALVDKPAAASLEGYLYPDSYQKIAETKPQTIIRQSLDEMQKRLTPELRAGLVAQKLTVHQGVIMASIVEREVSNPNDRQQVAQVLLRRLQEDMKLESDATASYGAILDGKEPSLSYDSPYNTYKHDGLPPGPISNVSAASLQAVASPADTDWLYFVSGDDGKTYFSHTYQEHEALVKQHCKKLCNQ
jgi:UPF0755 protein